MQFQPSTGIKLAYGLGQAADGIKTTAFSTFLFFYYNQVLELSGSLAGAAALLALVVDAITDPMVGQLSDRWRSRWGRRHPFMLAGALPFTLGMVALFNPPAGLGEWGLFAWMLIGGIVVRLMLTLFFVPHLSLGAEMVKDYHERTGLIGYRVFFSNVGVVMTSVLGFALFFPTSPEYANGMLDAGSYPGFGLFVGLTATAAMLVSVVGTRSVIPHLVEPKSDPNALHPLLAFVTVFMTLREYSFRILFSTTLMFMILVGITQTLVIHVATYIFGFQPDQMAFMASSVVVGLVLAPAIAQWSSRRLDKKNGFAFCVVTGAAFASLPYFLYFAGFLEIITQQQKLMLVFFTNGMSQGFFIACVIIIDSMLSDVVDQHELQTGLREEGLFFAARSLATKASYGLGSFFAGIALDVIQFPSAATVDTVPQSAIDSLAMLAGPLSLCLFVMTVFVSHRYPLNAARHSDVLRRIAEKNASTASGLKAA